MPDLAISSATLLTGATIASVDLIPVLDVSAAAGSKGSRITVDELFTGRTLLNGAATGLTSLGIRSTGAAFDLTLASDEVLTAGRTLKFNVGNADRTLTIPATGTAALLGTANSFTAGQTIAPSSAATCLTLTGGTVTTSNPLISATQTWNAGAVTFTGLFLNVTSTASAAASLLMNLQVGGTTALSVRKDGSITCMSGGGYFSALGSVLYLGSNGANFGGELMLNWSAAVVAVKSSFAYAWSSDSTSYGTRDLFLVRKAAATLQLGQDAAGVTNQTFTAANRITSDGVGANLTIAPGNGRGDVGGTLYLATYSTEGAGTPGTLTNRLSIDTAGNISVVQSNTRLDYNDTLIFYRQGSGNVLTFGNGVLEFADAVNMSFNTSTGTKIGTGSSQKLAFWNATPISQPTTGYSTATFSAGSSNISDNTATWDGYTIGSVVGALRGMGLLA